ncbi:Panacea domain-containing protein [Tropicimonas sp. IMCC6043]|uniref:Panacea domain-containing protein n=1 Tax=Tropicimonas sp. IMCC6043 TaxID=2510645 RepID=UPI0013EBFA90|nr:type II toxin-antitoxin system antitoxin SocA domain-containing protein [Tropicimonas sp. IMCC6043]
MSVFTIAEHILSQTGHLAPEKLERLVYFAQEDALADGLEPLFHEPIEAWDHGPVCPALYFRLQGRLLVHPGDLGGPGGGLTQAHAAVVRAMLDRLGSLGESELDALARDDAPWQRAHGGGARAGGSFQISEIEIAGARGGGAGRAGR